jgi:hypothetical protein
LTAAGAWKLTWVPSLVVRLQLCCDECLDES